MVETWESFFLGELGAAAAIAGLLFVSLSFNQQRILALPGIAERGLQALFAMLLVFVASAIVLIPLQPQWLVGVELVAAGVGYLLMLLAAQRAELKTTPRERQHHTRMSARFHLAVAWWFLIAAVFVLVRPDWTGFYLLAPATLLAFVVAGMNAWILLIEINR